MGKTRITNRKVGRLQLRTRSEAVPGSHRTLLASDMQTGRVNHLHVIQPLLAEHTSDECRASYSRAEKKTVCRALEVQNDEPAHCHKKSVPVRQEEAQFGKTRKEWLLSVGQRWPLTTQFME